MAKTLGKQINQGILAGGTEQYKGTLTAPLDPLFGSVYKSLTETASLKDPNDAATNSAIQDLLSGKSSYALDPKTTTDYFNKGVLNPLMAAFENQIKPKINQQFAASGRTFSAARGYAGQRALSDLTTAAESSLATGVFQNQGLEAQLADSARNRQATGVQLAQSQALQPFSRAQALQSALVPYQNYAQNLASTDYQRWQMAQPYNSPWLTQGQALLGSQQVALYNPANPYGQYIGAATGALSGAATGAAVGSVVPGIGTGIGAVAGLAIGAGTGYMNSSR